ncbi:hypothetical protein ACFLU5_08375 [Bacteroidota bacterium]
MNDNLKIQQRFFEELRNKLSTSLSLADVISDELTISIDSAYRRIRGETGLSFNEIKKLCTKFEMSLDSLFASAPNTVLFSYRAINPEKFNYDSYFLSIIDNMQALREYRIKEIIYGAKDIPIFYNFIKPRLAAFKLFFWMQDIFNFPGMKDMKFDPEAISSNTLSISKKVWESYVQVPSIEIWSEETISITLQQIDYYYDKGRFRSQEDAIMLMEEYKSIIEHQQKQAECGCKFQVGNETLGNETNLKLYYNNVSISDNTVYFKMKDFNMVHLGHNVMNILSTTDPSFCEDTFQILKNLMRKSKLVSVKSEKNRIRFFNNMYQKIDGFIEKIKNKRQKQ